jgi:hypothetical protein
MSLVEERFSIDLPGHDRAKARAADGVKVSQSWNFDPGGAGRRSRRKNSSPNIKKFKYIYCKIHVNCYLVYIYTDRRKIPFLGASKRASELNSKNF